MESSSSNEPVNYWIYLSDESKDYSALAISTRSLARRARVDAGNYLIDSDDYPVSRIALNSIESTGATVRVASRWLRAVSVRASSAQVDRIAEIPSVTRIDAVNELAASRPADMRPIIEIGPSPKSAALAYGVTRFQNEFIGAIKLHDAGLTGKGVLLAFFDTGFRTDHPAFDSTSIIATRDFINGGAAVDGIDCPGNSAFQLQTYHGTATVSTVAANVPDTFVGVAPGADFILAKTEISCDGTEIKLEEDNWIAAAEWADSIGADVINSSLGYFVFQDIDDEEDYTQSQLDGNTALITIAADIAASKNILVVNSAGNERFSQWGAINFPSDGDSVICVGATLPDSSLASFSSPGPSADGRVKPDISTLGAGVAIANHLGGYATSQGTSFSAPLVTGGAALALEFDPTLTADEIRNLMRQTASKSNSPDNDFGYGLYDAAAAANILSIAPIPTIAVAVGETVMVPINTSGRTQEIPSISSTDLPPAAILTDFGDGTAELSVSGLADVEAEIEAHIVAQIADFADSQTVRIQTYLPTGSSIYAAPNPFQDELNIFVLPVDNQYWRAISIFNAAGELVWERVNNSGSTADVIVKWDGRAREGENVASGVYLVRVATSRTETILKVLKAN